MALLRLTIKAMRISILLLLACLVFSHISRATAKPLLITIAAGKFDRRETLVSFMMPVEAKEKFYRLRDATGRTFPLQIDSERRARFVLDELKAGATEIFRLEAVKTVESSSERIEVKRDRDDLHITVAGRPVLAYRMGKGVLPRPDIKPVFRRGGYIHSVLTPSGREVTDDYPPNHLHHHGIWAAWTKTEFEGRRPDFWNMGDATGTVEFVSLDAIWNGTVDGGFTSRHRYVDLSAPQPKTVLDEVWQVNVYRVGRGKNLYWMFDLVSKQENVAGSSLVLPEYHYGGVGFRGRREWDGKENTFFLTSEGRDRTNGHATRARWCDIGGRVDGALAGIAILGHPENFRAPEPMRIHPTEPFFNYAPSQLGRWEIAPNRPHVSRYRFIVHDGAPDKIEIDRLWNDYADPPQVTVS